MVHTKDSVTKVLAWAQTAELSDLLGELIKLARMDMFEGQNMEALHGVEAIIKDRFGN